eukprot:1158532-Pelagomonas_calceolata.AAC.3
MQQHIARVARLCSKYYLGDAASVFLSDLTSSPNTAVKLASRLRRTRAFVELRSRVTSSNASSTLEATHKKVMMASKLRWATICSVGGEDGCMGKKVRNLFRGPNPPILTHTYTHTHPPHNTRAHTHIPAPTPLLATHRQVSDPLHRPAHKTLPIHASFLNPVPQTHAHAHTHIHTYTHARTLAAVMRSLLLGPRHKHAVPCSISSSHAVFSKSCWSTRPFKLLLRRAST